MKLFIAILLSLSSLQCFGEWVIIDTNIESYVRENYSGGPELRIVQTLQNKGKKNSYILGQDFGGGNYYYHIESFVKGLENQTWKKLNSSMGGSIGKTIWIEVKPNETIEFTTIIYAKYLESERLLTFKEASSPSVTITSGETVLVGPHLITKHN